MTSCVCQANKCSTLTDEAASSPRKTAATAAASAACASYASSAAAYAAASAAYPSAASAASYYYLGILLAGHINFFVENKERPQANVKDFLFIESKLRWGIPQM
jgi:hypothetical protein